MKKVIQEILSTGENDIIEFKKSVGEWKEVIETISAFSNHKGGTILVGVEVNSNVIGVDIGKGTVEDIVNKIKTNTDAPVLPEIIVERYNNLDVIRIVIPEEQLKPVYAFGRAYKRVGKTNQIMSKDEEVRLYLSSRGITWDETIIKEVSLEEIDDTKLNDFLKRAKKERNWDIDEKLSKEDILKNMGLLKNESLTRASILLFGKKPQKYFLQAEVSAGRFKDDERTEFIDIEKISGDLISQVEKTIKFIQRNIKLKAKVEGSIERKEEWEYPLEAYREAVINAICHRDYTDAGNIQVEIYDDRIEVINPGKLPEELSLDLLKQKHRSIPHNKLIAWAFHKIKFIEQWGTGIKRMMNSLSENDFPEPEFIQQKNTFRIIIRKSILTEEYLKNLGLNNRQIKAVKYVKEKGKITNKEYQELCGLKKRQATDDLKELETKEVFERKGKTGKGTYYILKGRQTGERGIKGAPKGREI